MKRILFSLMTLVLVIGLVGAGAFAYFSDEETSEGNSFTAGTLDLDFDGDSLPFEVGNTFPGDSGEETQVLVNSGSIDAGMVTLTIINLVDDENSQNEPELVVDPTADVGELSGVLDLVITADLDDDDVFETNVYTGTLAALATAGETDIGPIAATSQIAVNIAWSIDGESVGDEIQSDNVTFDVQFNLYQTAP